MNMRTLKPTFLLLTTSLLMTSLSACTPGKDADRPAVTRAAPRALEAWRNAAKVPEQ